MIERLVTSLQMLVRADAEQIEGLVEGPIGRDCADALRLELDCPQEALSPEQRAILSRLSHLLEEGGAPAPVIAAVARGAGNALGISSLLHN
jgi:hypothetical protein